MIFIDKKMVLWEKNLWLYGTLIYEIKKNRLQKNKKLKKPVVFQNY